MSQYAYASVSYYEEMPHVKKRIPPQDDRVSLLEFPKVFYVRDSGKTLIKGREIILSSWRHMLKELEDDGYNITQVSRATGVPRRTVQRWFNGEEDLPGYFLFSKVLYLYCFLKCKQVTRAPQGVTPKGPKNKKGKYE